MFCRIYFSLYSYYYLGAVAVIGCLHHGGSIFFKRDSNKYTMSSNSGLVQRKTEATIAAAISRKREVNQSDEEGGSDDER